MFLLSAMGFLFCCLWCQRQRLSPAALVLANGHYKHCNLVNQKKVGFPKICALITQRAQCCRRSQHALPTICRAHRPLHAPTLPARLSDAATTPTRSAGPTMHATPGSVTPAHALVPTCRRHARTNSAPRSTSHTRAIQAGVIAVAPYIRRRCYMPTPDPPTPPPRLLQCQ
jgi:hypothetical protein